MTHRESGISLAPFQRVRYPPCLIILRELISHQQGVPVDEIWKKVLLPDLCQLEKGVQFLAPYNTLQLVISALGFNAMDHMELVNVLKLPGT